MENLASFVYFLSYFSFLFYVIIINNLSASLRVPMRLRVIISAAHVIYSSGNLRYVW